MMAHLFSILLALAAAATTQAAFAKDRATPTLSLDASALSDEVVVYSPRQRHDLILHTIRPPAPDLAAVTDGLVSNDRPPSDPVANEKRIQAALIDPPERAKER